MACKEHMQQLLINMNVINKLYGIVVEASKILQGYKRTKFDYSFFQSPCLDL